MEDTYHFAQEERTTLTDLPEIAHFLRNLNDALKDTLYALEYGLESIWINLYCLLYDLLY